MAGTDGMTGTRARERFSERAQNEDGVRENGYKMGEPRVYGQNDGDVCEGSTRESKEGNNY